jgi:hypothetical protein
MATKRTEDMTVAETMDAIFGEGTAEREFGGEDLEIARHPYIPEVGPADEPIATWRDRNGNGQLKLFRVPRATIDEGSRWPDALELVWIDGAGVRRGEIRLDTAARRLSTLDDWDFRRLAGWVYGMAPTPAMRLIHDVLGTDPEAWLQYESYAVQLIGPTY